MFEKELKFALNNEWAIDNFIAEMTNDNETIYLLEPEEISIVPLKLSSFLKFVESFSQIPVKLSFPFA